MVERSSRQRARRVSGCLLLVISAPGAMTASMAILGIHTSMIAALLWAVAVGGSLLGDALIDPQPAADPPRARRPTLYCCALAEYDGAPWHPCEASA